MIFARLIRDRSILEPFALWVENTKLKFFAPPDPAHVSHSIVNCQNDYAQDAPHIEVATTTPEALLSKYDLKTVPLMKLDIEGAEINVIPHMLENAIHVRQLLVEFDEMNFPSERSKKNVEDTDRMLKYGRVSVSLFRWQIEFSLRAPLTLLTAPPLRRTDCAAPGLGCKVPRSPAHPCRCTETRRENHEETSSNWIFDRVVYTHRCNGAEQLRRHVEDRSQ